MITIHSAKIDTLSTFINIKVSTIVNHTIDKLLFWVSSDYDDSLRSIDLTHLLSQTSEVETFNISASDVNLESFTEDFFILEFQSENSSAICPERENCVDNCEIAIAVVGNFTSFSNCIINKTLEVELKDCKLDDKGKNVVLASTLLDALFINLELEEFKNASKVLDILKNLCFDCNCYNLKSTNTNLVGVHTSNDLTECSSSNQIKRYPC